MSTTRILLSFKPNDEQEQELLEFLEKKSKFISKSGYLKMLLAEKLEEEKRKFSHLES